MKKFGFLAILTVSSLCSQGGAAYAAPMDICLQIQSSGYSSSALQCQGMVADGYFQPDATALCATISRNGYTSSALTCLSDIKNKVYPGSLLLCQNYVTSGYTSTALSCLKQMAREYVPAPPAPACRTVYRLESRIDQAIHQLRIGNPVTAEQLLIEIKRELMSQPR